MEVIAENYDEYSALDILYTLLCYIYVCCLHVSICYEYVEMHIL